MKIFVVIPNWNGADWITECLDSLQKLSTPATIIVVDNGSVDKSVELIEKLYPRVILIKLTGNTGFAGGVNTGIKYAMEHDADAVALFNNDALADKNWLGKLAAAMQADSKVGVVTGKLLHMDKERLDSAGEFYAANGMPAPRGRNLIDSKQYDSGEEVFAATGGASLYRASMLNDIGLFDEDFFAYYEDVDISFRARLAGWKVWYEPAARAYHHLSATSSKLGTFRRYQGTKNFFLLYEKNMPGWLFWKYLPLFITQSLRLGLSSTLKGHPLVFAKAFWRSLMLLPSTLKKRRRIQKSRTVSISVVDTLLVGKYPSSETILRVLLLALVLLLPFHTLFTTWAASHYGHIYLISAWKELLVLFMGVIAAYRVYKQPGRYKSLLTSLNALVIAYVLFNLVYVLIAANRQQAVLGFAVNTRFLICFLLAQVAASATKDFARQLAKIIIVSALVVATFGIMQASVLPNSFLEHFGYEAAGQHIPGVPPASVPLTGIEGTVRSQSTLRGPNPLGAYLVLPICLLIAQFRRDRKARYLAALGVLMAALYETHSRSAWIACAVAALGLTYHLLVKRISYFIVAGILMLAGVTAVAYNFRSTNFVQTVVLHRNNQTPADNSSNNAHLRALAAGVRDIKQHPLGSGLGTAGPVSVLPGRSSHARVAENYFLQIGQEVGWPGLVLFSGITVMTGVELWRRRSLRLSLVAFVTFIGLTLSNLLLHTWADEVVSMIWWTFAGSLIVTTYKKTPSSRTFHARNKP